MSAEKPKPIIDVWNKPFWDACAEGRLVLQKCAATGKCWYPPAPTSPYEPGADWEWTEVSGRGRLVSWVVFHHNYFAGFADEIPYNVSLVTLDEGASMLTNVNAEGGELAAGAPVSVVFEDRGDVTVPVFRLLEDAA